MHTKRAGKTKREDLSSSLAMAALLAAMIFASLPATAFASGALPPLPHRKPLVLEDAHVPVRLSAAPRPLAKPDFTKPDIVQLLNFGKPPIPLRRPLNHDAAFPSSEDAVLYKKIFSLQSQAAWDKADDLMVRLHDMRLRGHVLYQRYTHPTAYRASYRELAGWLDLYADHPGAGRIYKMALARKPKGESDDLKRPLKGSAVASYLDIISDNGKTYTPSVVRTASQRAALNKLNSAIRKAVGDSAPARALKHLEQDKAAALYDSVEYDDYRALIAQGFMASGDLAKALALAKASAARSGNNVPLAGWIGGLVSWRMGQYAQAGMLFELTATSPYSSSWNAAGGAYWASRAYMRTGRVQDVGRWLKAASAYPRTFYGLIATRALGLDFDFNWDMPAYTKDHEKRLLGIPAAKRAMALVKAGQYHMAEAELRQINSADASLREALLAYANDAGLPSFAMRLAEAYPHPGGGLYDAALYPLLPWNPQGGYKIDRALILALIRQESRFDPEARSGSGAMGLMQLLPSTASFVSRTVRYRGKEGQHSLKNPEVNLDIGQRYVISLLGGTEVNTELLSLMVAYNAGPGNLRKWKRELGSIAKDPLMFIESIPSAQARNYVERVMSNYWIYRMRLGQPSPSLEAVVEGRWARYAPLDGVKQAGFALPRSFAVADGR